MIKIQMIKILIIITILYTYINAKEHIIAPLNVAVPELQKIEKYAIILKGGKNKIYVFVDPFCRYSKAFIKKIYNKKNKLRKKYSYYIFLLKLKKFNSLNTMKYILSSKNKNKVIQEIMIKNKIYEKQINENEEIKKEIEEIKKVGKKLDIFKRPYMFIVKKNWKETLEEEW